MEHRLDWNSWKRAALVLAATLLPTTLAHADLGFRSKALIGTWRHPTNGDVYTFNSNATYTFTAGSARARSGQASYTGWWKIAQPTERESGGSMEGPVALVLKTKTRSVLRNDTNVVTPSQRMFRLVVNIAHKGDNEVDSRFYNIGNAKWCRTQ